MPLRSKLSDVHILEDVSWPQFVFQNFESYGSRTAIVDGVSGRSYTFDQLTQLTRKCGSALNKRGFKKGDVFAILLPNIPEFPIVYYSVISIGGVVTTVNPLYTVGELTHQLQDSRAKFIITIPIFAGKAQESASSVGIETVYVVGEAEGCEPFSDLLGDSGDDFPENVEINPKDDIACLPYSSGTTGSPKGVMLTHYNLIADASIVTHDSFMSMSDDSVILGLLPFFHSFGQVISLSCALRNGGKIICVPKFEPESFLKVIQDHKVTHAALVPSTILFLVKSPLVDQYDVSSLEDITSGASPLGEDLSMAIVNRLPSLKSLRQGYGMTELSPVCHVSPFANIQYGSVGVLLPNLECKVIDIENGKELGPKKDGEICIRGPTVMKGYLNNPEATAQTIDPEGWLHTGDIGLYDENEQFYIVDRLKELIKYKGFQVPPAELEALLISHSAIEDAGVIGVSDPSAGELPKAYVVLKANVTITEEEVVKFVQERVAPHKTLRGGVQFIDKIPKSASGKILRRELKERGEPLTEDSQTKGDEQNILKSKYPDVAIPDNLSWTEFVFENFDEYGDKIAIQDCVTNHSYTYNQVKDMSRRCASALNKRGFCKGNVFALFMPNVPEFAIVYFGVLQAGGTITSINPLFTTEELLKQVRLAGAQWLLTVPPLLHRVKEAKEHLGKGKIFVLGDIEGFESASVLLEDDGSSVPDVSINPKEDIAVIPFSSGTTGYPKGVMLTHYNLVANGCMMRSEGFVTFDKSSVIIGLLPFFHSYGMVGVMSMGLHFGSTILSLPKFDRDKFLKILENCKVTHLPVVPPVVLLLAKHPTLDDYDLSFLTEITSGAAPLGEELSVAVTNRLPLLSRVRQGYGMTELSPVSHMTPLESPKHGSVGVLLPNLQCKVLDLETGEALGAGKDGEICVRGPTVMKGYLNNDAATAQTLDKDGWVHTGDIGHYDNEQHFFIVDRVKELIKYKAYQVPPAELESLLISHPDIEDAAVIGVPDDEAGELPKAFVVRKPDRTLTERDVEIFVDENVAPYKKLRGGIEFVDAIPKSLSGKILRRELKDRVNETKPKDWSSTRRSTRKSERHGHTERILIGRQYMSANRSACCIII